MIFDQISFDEVSDPPCLSFRSHCDAIIDLMSFLFVSLSVCLLIIFNSTFVLLSGALFLEYSLCFTLYILESFFMFLGQSSTI
jgi:hypothetical protein